MKKLYTPSNSKMIRFPVAAKRALCNILLICISLEEVNLKSGRAISLDSSILRLGWLEFIFRTALQYSHLVCQNHSSYYWIFQNLLEISKLVQEATSSQKMTGAGSWLIMNKRVCLA